ncbi:MAG: hypothetical protein ACYCUI_15675 [Vulcanimicrobiaceae bacterium]
MNETLAIVAENSAMVTKKSPIKICVRRKIADQNLVSPKNRQSKFGFAEKSPIKIWFRRKIINHDFWIAEFANYHQSGQITRNIFIGNYT